MAGHVVLYLMMRWLMVEAAIQNNDDPLRLSFTGALRELDRLRQTILQASPRHVQDYLLPLLLHRIASNRIVWRPGRYDPRPGDTKPQNKGHGRHQYHARVCNIQA